MKLVMSHKLRHAIMHRSLNCYFIRNKILLLDSKIGTEANMLAAELLIPDEIIIEHRDYTTEQLSRLLGYNQKLVEMRLKSFTY